LIPIVLLLMGAIPDREVIYMAKKTKKSAIEKKAAAARGAALELGKLKHSRRRAALKAISAAIRERSGEILKANAADVREAKKEVEAGRMSLALLKRLAADADKVRGMATGVDSVAKLPDPVGRVTFRMELDEGLVLERVTCPIGVVGAVFESRPDAVPQISSLCLKSGNAVLLKGGAEARRSNRVLVKIISEAAASVEGVPAGWIQLMETREEVNRILKLDEYIDMLVPRGSNAFVKYIQDNTTIPVLGHSDGICHVYVDSMAKKSTALNVALDSKIQYPAACNAAETLLVHKDIAKGFLPEMVQWFTDAGVEVAGCPKTRKIVSGLKAANEADWSAEYLDMKISVKVVDTMADAIAHINKYGSGHTDAIVTQRKKRAEFFMESVDSACVFHNASTRFSDGYRFGLGAELGISTNKTHARGPVGVEGLVIYNYRLHGAGQIVDDYSGPFAKKFTHRKLQ